jgi:hypothetical protein
MYPWPTAVRQKAANTSLGIVGRSFTYWASPETDRSQLSAVCALAHQYHLKTHDKRVMKKVIIYIPCILYELQFKSFLNFQLFTCNSSCDGTVSMIKLKVQVHYYCENKIFWIASTPVTHEILVHHL